LNTISPSIHHLKYYGEMSEKFSLLLSRLPWLSSLWLAQAYWRRKGPGPATFLLSHTGYLRNLTLSDTSLYDLGGLADILSAIPSLENLTICNIRSDGRRGFVCKLPHLSPIRMHIQDLSGILVAALADMFGSDEKVQLVSLGLDKFNSGDPTENTSKFIGSYLENLQMSGEWDQYLINSIDVQQHMGHSIRF
jgi:hypothetical protein